MKPKTNGLRAVAVLKFARNCVLRLLSVGRPKCKGACDARGWKPQAKEEEVSTANK